MKKLYLIVILLFFTAIYSYSQSKRVTISGYIQDSGSGESLPGASVYDSKTVSGVSSNNFGFYSFTLSSGSVNLVAVYMGYENFELDFDLQRDTVINIRLRQNSVALDGATVIAQRSVAGVRSSQISSVTIPMSLIKKVPVFLGESDPIKVIQLLPGVQSGSEGSAGLYVRGGGPDQNLVLLDGVPLYNVNHLGGLFSVFNNDAINSVTLYKGGFPARFGSRLSSVLDITMKDGNENKLRGSVSVGLISSRINLEGPLFSEKTTFNISARRTYIDLLLQPFLYIFNIDSDEKYNGGYNFYDINAKLTHRFSEKDKIYVSLYGGDDVLNVRYSSKGSHYNGDNVLVNWDDRAKQGIRWGNFLSSVRWNHLFGNKLFMNTTAAYTQYRNNIFFDIEENSDLGSGSYYKVELDSKARVNDISLKFDFDYTPTPNHDMKLGLNYTYHNFQPGRINMMYQEKWPDENIDVATDTTFNENRINSHETALYFEDNISVGNRLKANLGLHYSTYSLNDKFYHSLQPRISMRLLLSEDVSVKAGFAQMSQYIHLLSNSSLSLPTDLWVPVTERIKPMKSIQYSMGFFYNYKNLIDFSVEGYYKTMDNLIEYKDGVTFIGIDKGWEEKVNMGRGWSYGVEFLAQKNVGRTTGWIAYTWSKAERLFDRPGEEINFGEVFPAKYDRRHDLNIVLMHQFSEKFDISATWICSSGNWATFGTNIYEQHGRDWPGEIDAIDGRNNFQLPTYHKLDIGVNFHKQKRHGKRTWNISVSNAYNRMNPYSMYVTSEYERDDMTGEWISVGKLMKITLFPIIPSFSYTYTF